MMALVLTGAASDDGGTSSMARTIRTTNRQFIKNTKNTPDKRDREPSKKSGPSKSKSRKRSNSTAARVLSNASELEGEDSEDDNEQAKAKMSEMTKHFMASPTSTTKKPTGKQRDTPMNLWTNMLNSIIGAATDID